MLAPVNRLDLILLTEYYRALQEDRVGLPAVQQECCMSALPILQSSQAESSGSTLAAMRVLK